MQNNRAFLVKSASIASIITAGILLIVKISAFEITGALAILATLIDSVLDIAASVINFFAVRYALNPADHEHRFGHGKAEALAGLSQATLITTSVILLLIESSSRFLNPIPIQKTEIGIIVTVLSILLTAILVLYQSYVIKKTSSLAIKADQLHYKTDFLLNGAVLLSLFITYISDIPQIDSVLAIIISIFILWGVKGIFTQSIDQILDHELPDEERKKIFKLATSHPKVHEIHDLRTRTSGGAVFIQFHMELPPEMLLLDVHRICEEVETYITKNCDYEIEVFIHPDPLGHPRENPESFTAH